MKLFRIIGLLSLACVALASQLSAYAEITEGGTGIPYGQDHAHFLTAPLGWVLDTESGAGQGVYATFYPKGSNWNGVVAAYSNANPREGKSDDALIAEDIARMKKRNPNLVVTNGGTLLTKDGKKAIVRYFTGDSFGNAEAVAYVPEPKVFVNIVLTARNEEIFNLTMPAFRQLVRSYEFITDDPSRDLLATARKKRLKDYVPVKEPVTLEKLVFRSLDKPSKLSTLHRAGTDFMRMDVSADGKNDTRTIAVINTPDIWAVDNTKGVAQHLIDPGPVFGAALPIFAEFATAPNSPIKGLEYGLEYDYFQRHAAKRLPPAVIAGHAVDQYRLVLDGTTLTLVTKKGSKVPWRLSAVKGVKKDSLEYVSYETGLPFKPELFTAPKGVKIVETSGHQIKGNAG